MKEIKYTILYCVNFCDSILFFSSFSLHEIQHEETQQVSLQIIYKKRASLGNKI